MISPSRSAASAANRGGRWHHPHNDDGFYLKRLRFSRLVRALIEIIRNSLTLLGISTFRQGTFVGTFIVLAVEADDLRHAQGLHESIEKAIRLRRPEAARNAVRKLLANTDEVIAGV